LDLETENAKQISNVSLIDIVKNVKSPGVTGLKNIGNS